MSDLARIVVLDDYQGCAADFADWSVFEGRAIVEFVHRHLDEEELCRFAAGAEIVVAMRERTPFPARVLERLDGLRLLVTTAPDNAVIDVAAANARGVVVCGTRRAGGGVVEHAWGLILALVKNIPLENQAVRSGAWQVAVGSQLGGARLGIVGLGHLGSEMLPAARAFGMEVVAWSQNLDPAHAASLGVRAVTREELFSTADVVTVHLRLSERTRGLIGAADFARMKPTAYIVNTSRGPVLDERALVAALERHEIAGAGLDVFDEEPLPSNHPLLDLQNVVITPHIAYVTRETYAIFFPDVVEDIEAFLQGSPIRVVVPKAVG